MARTVIEGVLVEQKGLVVVVGLGSMMVRMEGVVALVLAELGVSLEYAFVVVALLVRVVVVVVGMMGRTVVVGIVEVGPGIVVGIELGLGQPSVQFVGIVGIELGLVLGQPSVVDIELVRVLGQQSVQFVRIVVGMEQR